MALFMESPYAQRPGLGRSEVATTTLLEAIAANTTDVTSPAFDVSGINGALTIEVVKTGAGTCTFAMGGTLDSFNKADDSSFWTPVRLDKLGIAAPGLVITDPIGAGTVKRMYAVAMGNYFPTIRPVISAVVGVVSVSVRIAACPV